MLVASRESRRRRLLPLGLAAVVVLGLQPVFGCGGDSSQPKSVDKDEMKKAQSYMKDYGEQMRKANMEKAAAKKKQ